jgi:hypothetical protein
VALKLFQFTNICRWSKWTIVFGEPNQFVVSDAFSPMSSTLIHEIEDLSTQSRFAILTVPPPNIQALSKFLLSCDRKYSYVSWELFAI